MSPHQLPASVVTIPYCVKIHITRLNYYSFLLIILTISLFIPTGKCFADSRLQDYILTSKIINSFPLTDNGKAAALVIDTADYPGVKKVAIQLQRDIFNITNIKPTMQEGWIPRTDNIIILGTIGHSQLIQRLISENKLDVSKVRGKWDTYIMQSIENPIEGVAKALIIAGSNKRGTIYGMYDLSAAIGVSPWYWWADVPLKKKANIFIKPIQYSPGEPKVKYRGIFINDEAPALSGWVHENYGKFNAKFYEKVFELILRLKGNFLWPAMWGRAFYDDDPENPRLADEYGVVIGTSHHEPMMRAHVEWERYGSGPWDYSKNEAKLKQFWTEGIKRMNDYESIVTLAMRGDGDEPMSQEANISLLEKIVKDQRQIITDVTEKPVESIPQVWALYKEVQEYYDKGMRVPDDVTLLLCDDNWGNIRKLPKLDDKSRAGGYGIYYHYDYVGGPRNYKWLNTNQISRVWEQMHLAYSYGVDRIWIVNVGDIKPMEFPISFFLDYAWNPDKLPAEKLPEYTRQWAEDQFGKQYAEKIAHILTEYTRYNSRRKPELLEPGTYSLTNYEEADRVVKDYNVLYTTAKSIYDSLEPDYKSAFYELVLHPVEACSNLNDLYVTTAKNRFYAEEGRNSTNVLAEKVKALFDKDQQITDYYNYKLAGGKWNHMMDQTHIGYTYWQQPDSNSMPEVKSIEIPKKAMMGIAIEGSDKWWPGEKSKALLPVFDSYNRQSHYIDVFNRGSESFHFSVKAEEPWIVISKNENTVDTEQRIWISIDWTSAPRDTQVTPIIFSGPDSSTFTVYAVSFNPASPDRAGENGFIESNGYISIEAPHFSESVADGPTKWQIIPDLGRTLAAVTPLPVRKSYKDIDKTNPHLEYGIYLFYTGTFKLKTILSPTLNFHNNQGLRFAVSIDEEKPEIINIHKDRTFQDWEESVRTNSIVAESIHQVKSPGKHILKIWMIDPGIVIQKLILETGKMAPSYLGPPESYNSVLISN